MSSESKVIRAEISLPAVSQVLSVTVPENSRVISVNVPNVAHVLSVKTAETVVKEVQTPGLKGDKGEAFKYEDFTEAQLESIKSSVVSAIGRQSLSEDEIIDLV